MTNFEKIMQEMNPETMANLRVKQIIVNNSEPFYVTSTGQLYTFDNLRGAVIAEYNWLISNTPEENKNDAEAITPESREDKDCNEA